MKTEDIIKHLKQQDENIIFYKKQITKLEQQIDTIKTLGIKYIEPVDLKLNTSLYSDDVIKHAYILAKEYEGLDVSKTSTILDTFIEFLNGNHHTL